MQLTLIDTNGREFQVNVYEFQSIEPAMYAHEEGYYAMDDEENEWFVSLSGRADVMQDPKSEEGCWIEGAARCLHLEEESAKMEAELAKYEESDEWRYHG